jgi:hypothetical protein
MSAYNEPIMPARILSKLRAAMTMPRDEYIDDFVEWALKKYIDRERLVWSIEHDFDVVTAALNHFGLGHSQVSPLLKTVLRMNWDRIEETLTDVNIMRDILLEKEELNDILHSEEGISYLNRCCKSAYQTIYNFVWG